ncbi:hypothetical protein ABZ725_14700 [Streptomyces sp. NPDC006872]|uniref:hypothetical protein n=1 Tax=Streptomyces sp. NPDC006872 TaxID=3155720 RepID=UPI0033F1B5F4
MRILWLLLAILLTCLTIGGLMSATKGADTPSTVGDLAISLLLGLGAAACWRRVRLPSRQQSGDGERPWRR